MNQHIPTIHFQVRKMLVSGSPVQENPNIDTLDIFGWSAGLIYRKLKGSMTHASLIEFEQMMFA